MTTTPPTRRWFQFGLGTMFGFTTSLALLWWLCAQWPVTDAMPGVIEKERELNFSEVYLQRTGMRETFLVPADVPFERLPTRAEVAWRGLLGSAALIAVWLLALAVVAWEARRRSLPKSPQVYNGMLWKR